MLYQLSYARVPPSLAIFPTPATCKPYSTLVFGERRARDSEVSLARALN